MESCPGCGSPMRHIRRLVSCGLPCDYGWHEGRPPVPANPERYSPDDPHPTPPQGYADYAPEPAEIEHQGKVYRRTTGNYRGAWGEGNEIRLYQMLEQAVGPAPEGVTPGEQPSAQVVHGIAASYVAQEGAGVPSWEREPSEWMGAPDPTTPAYRPAAPDDDGAWTDELWAKAIYTASLVEPYPTAVPAWDSLPDRTRETYRKRARRAVELVTQYLAEHQG